MINKENISDSQEYLNIKEAAAILGVSEISLRRWTDAGKLPCFRVGGRRERRFLRNDLVAFLESQGRVAPGQDDRADNPCARRGVLLEGMSISHGRHLCSVYESDKGRLKLAVPFLSQGLHVGDTCFLTAEQGSRSAILEALAGLHDDLDAMVDAGQLVLSDGMNSSDEMLGYLEQQFQQVTRSGKCCIRLLGDMSWFIEKGLGLDELYDYENRYNQTLGRQYPVVSLCQYDARKFSGIGIVNALKSHQDTFDYPLPRFIGL